MMIMERAFEHEFGSSKLEQVETGVILEHCEPVWESAFEEDDSDLLFGCVEIPQRAESDNDLSQYGIAEQLYSADLIREIPVLVGLLPPACGTSVMDIEYLLDSEEFSCESLHGASLADITEALAQDSRVLCKIRIPYLAEEVSILSAQESFCIAEVRGIDLRDPNAAKVCLESLGCENSTWICSLEEFMKAWSSYDCSCYVIYRE